MTKCGKVVLISLKKDALSGKNFRIMIQFCKNIFASFVASTFGILAISSKTFSSINHKRIALESLNFWAREKIAPGNSQAIIISADLGSPRIFLNELLGTSTVFDARSAVSPTTSNTDSCLVSTRKLNRASFGPGHPFNQLI